MDTPTELEEEVAQDRDPMVEEEVRVTEDRVDEEDMVEEAHPMGTEVEEDQEVALEVPLEQDTIDPGM